METSVVVIIGDTYEKLKLLIWYYMYFDKIPDTSIIIISGNKMHGIIIKSPQIKSSH